jgi:hypothetical protein
VIKAEELISVLFDNECAQEIEGDIHHFTISLHCVNLDVVARRIRPCDVTKDMQVIRGQWEILSYDINEFWA